MLQIPRSAISESTIPLSQDFQTIGEQAHELQQWPPTNFHFLRTNMQVSKNMQLIIGK